MPNVTTNMGLYKAVGGDIARDYLKIDLAASLDVLDAHDHATDARGLAVGRVTLANAVYVQAKATTAVNYAAIGRNGSNHLLVGDSGLNAPTRIIAGGASYVTLEPAGSEKVRVTSTGLGVGMTPSNALDVTGTARVSGAVTLQSTLTLAAASGASAVLVAPTTGTNPAYARFQNTGGSLYVGMDDATGLTLGLSAAYAAFVWNSANTSLIFGTNGTERLRISNAGVFTLTGTLNVSGAVTFSSTVSGITTLTATTIAAHAQSGNITGSGSPNMTGFGTVSATSLVGALTGNAATATALQTARTINGTPFDGTANITVTAAAGTLTGATLNSTVLASSLTSVGVLASPHMTSPVVDSGGIAVTGNSTVTGTLSGITTLTASVQLTVSGAAATNRQVEWHTAGSRRWGISVDNTAEGGSNAGSDFNVWRYSDAGGLLGTALQIVRSTGNATFEGALAIGGTLTGVTTLTATTVVAALTGNASTATALQTARTINGVAFDGTANVTVTAAAGTLTGATLNATVTASSLTSVGVLAAPHMTAAVVDSGGLTVTAGGVAVTGNSTVTGTLSGVTTLTATTLAGTLSTAAQANITSVGTLTSLTTSGAVTAGAQINLGTGSSPAAGSIYKLAVNGTVVYAAAGSTDDFTLLNSAAATVLKVPTGTGNVVLNGGNLSGVATLTATSLAGTLTTAAQTNITSVGVLASPHMTAPVVDSGGLTVTAGGVGVTGNSTVTGTLSGITTLTASVQLTISGAAGTNRQVEWQTSGSRRWGISVDNVAEGGSNAGSDFNLYRYSDANAFLGTALQIVRSTGAVVFAGAVSGVTTLTATTLAGTLSTAAQANVTSLGTLTALAVSGTTTLTSSSASALVAGRQGATDPALKIDASTASSVTGLQVKSAAAAAGLALSVISSGTNENLTVDAKGSGTVSINATGTGGITLGRAVTVTTGGIAVTGNSTITGTLGGITTLTATTLAGALSTAAQTAITSVGTLTGLAVAGTVAVTSTSATAFAVGANGATNPALLVDANTASSATGLKITPAAAAGGVALAVISSGTNEQLNIDAKGSGTLNLNNTGTGDITLWRATSVVGTLAASSAVTGMSGTAPAAAGSAVAAFKMYSSAVGIYGGTGSPNTALTAPKGSLYIQTNATTTTSRLWINTDGASAWANFTTSA